MSMTSPLFWGKAVRGIKKRVGVVVIASIVTNAIPVGLAQAAIKFIPPVNREITQKSDLSNGQFARGGHRGVDYSVPEGTPVRASNSGVVTFAGETPEGRYVTIRHNGDITTTYGLGDIHVYEGQILAQGTIVGISGKPHAGGPFALHFGAQSAANM